METERHTLATGETAVTGFARLWQHWGWLFIIMTIVPWMWPGRASGSSTALTYAFGLLQGAVVPITIVSLIAIGIALTVSPLVYRTVEKLQIFLVGLIVLYFVFGLLTGESWSALLGGRYHGGPAALPLMPPCPIITTPPRPTAPSNTRWRSRSR